MSLQFLYYYCSVYYLVIILFNFGNGEKFKIKNNEENEEIKKRAD